MAYRLILAEASPAAQKALETALAPPEFEVWAFADGDEAVKALPSVAPDAVLTALSLPGRDGYELAAALRSQEAYRRTALFLLRGVFEPLDARKVSRLDPDGLIQKPFDGESLLAAVRAAVERRQAVPSLPEEPAGTSPVPPSGYLPEPAPPTDLLPEWTDAVERKIRAVVREEVLRNQAEMEDRARDIVSSEFKKVLVAELKAVDPEK
ncbi:MAG: response regulator transcription factor [Candidatus Aminicenantes bacterium]|nr:response regulator transcription factor [Candidatus Aminicenantes bacterium]